MIINNFSPVVIYNPLSSSFGSLRTDSENDQFLLLHPDYFSTASINQKLAALQLVSDWETEYYGLSYNIPVLVENLDRNELAVYSDRTRTLTINLQHLENSDPWDLIQSVCHEVNHSYQYRLCDLYDSVDNSELKGLYPLHKAILKINVGNFVTIPKFGQ